MYMSDRFACRCRYVLRSLMAWLSVALLTAPMCRLGAQATPTAPLREWRAWAFGSVGPARTWQLDSNDRPGALFASLGGGLAVSYGGIVGIVRANDTERVSFGDTFSNKIYDYAVLAGARSRGDRLFVTAAAGVAKTTLDLGGSSIRHLAPTLDLSAHADYRIAGAALALSGVLGPTNTRYVAISLGVALGWLGF
jgi:hypothetical protein